MVAGLASGHGLICFVAATSWTKQKSIDPCIADKMGRKGFSWRQTRLWAAMRQARAPKHRATINKAPLYRRLFSTDHY